MTVSPSFDRFAKLEKYENTRKSVSSGLLKLKNMFRVVFENCKFDNELLIIDTESSVTFLGFEEQQVEKKQERIKELLEKRKARQEQNNSPI